MSTYSYTLTLLYRLTSTKATPNSLIPITNYFLCVFSVYDLFVRTLETLLNMIVNSLDGGDRKQRNYFSNPSDSYTTLLRMLLFLFLPYLHVFLLFFKNMTWERTVILNYSSWTIGVLGYTECILHVHWGVVSTIIGSRKTKWIQLVTSSFQHSCVFNLWKKCSNKKEKSHYKTQHRDLLVNFGQLLYHSISIFIHP